MYVLSPHQVHICTACLSENNSNISYLVSLLSDDERYSASNFRYVKDQLNFIISRGILRCLLGSYLNKDPQDIQIIYGLWGKPCLPERQLYFNLSHSRDHVIYAITQEYEVGIDLEYIDQSLDIDLLVSSILSSQELVHWEKTKAEDKLNTFYQIWVCKEAFLKAIGKGWINNPQVTVLSQLDCFKYDSVSLESHEKMKFPFYIEIVPRYAGAYFIDGPYLPPLLYTWRSFQESMKL